MRHLPNPPTQVPSLLVLTLTLAVGCGASSETPEAEGSSGGESAAYEGPIASTDVAAGASLFETHCGDCHPDGGEDTGPSLIAEPHSPAQLRQQIREGSGRMRPFSEKRLSAEDMESVLAYLASIHAVE